MTKSLFRVLIYAVVFAALVCLTHQAEAAAVYYSVGQNTSDHKTGTPTVTIADGVATFSAPQTAANMGVGDVIDYDSDNKKCYISGKTSQSVWTCVSATGGAPVAVSGATVNSISHAFNSLSAAINGASDSDHLNTTDLANEDYVLNIPCYYDSGPDTTSVTVSGYTTSVYNYIKIYTPNNTLTESNQSQRHNGKWDDFKYKLVTSYSDSARPSINNSVNHIRIEGLQIWRNESLDAGEGYMGAINCDGFEPTIMWDNADIRISFNIIRGRLDHIDRHPAGIYIGGRDDSSGSFRIWNNIIYDIQNPTNNNGLGICALMENSSVNFYVYNNTVINIHRAFVQHGDNVYFTAKNNIAYKSVTTNYYGNYTESSCNNLSGPAMADAPSCNSQNEATVIFEDETNRDLRLKASDVNARGKGADLSSDADLAFNTDIEGQLRLTPWDIGADQSHRIILRIGSGAQIRLLP
jgi:hypothetical protein